MNRDDLAALRGIPPPPRGGCRPSNRYRPGPAWYPDLWAGRPRLFATTGLQLRFAPREQADWRARLAKRWNFVPRAREAPYLRMPQAAPGRPPRESATWTLDARLLPDSYGGHDRQKALNGSSHRPVLP